jgi:hypothetical protein
LAGYYRKTCNCIVWIYINKSNSNGDVAGVNDKEPGILDAGRIRSYYQWKHIN